MTFVQLICLVLATSCFLSVSATPSYKFAYGVHDPNTKDMKEQEEYKDDNGQLHGYYRLLDADGLTRTVTYKAHPSTGFEAHVERAGPNTADDVPAIAEPNSLGADYGWSSTVDGSPAQLLPGTGQLPAGEMLRSLVTRPLAWSTSTMHRIDPAGHESASAMARGYAGDAPAAYAETKTASTVIHPPSEIAATEYPQSRYSYGRPSAYAGTPPDIIPQYDSPAIPAAGIRQSYSPSYQYSPENTPYYTSQSSRTYPAGGLYAESDAGPFSNLDAPQTIQYAAEPFNADAEPCQ